MKNFLILLILQNKLDIFLSFLLISLFILIIFYNIKLKNKYNILKNEDNQYEDLKNKKNIQCLKNLYKKIDAPVIVLSSNFEINLLTIMFTNICPEDIIEIEYRIWYEPIFNNNCQLIVDKKLNDLKSYSSKIIEINNEIDIKVGVNLPIIKIIKIKYKNKNIQNFKLE